MPVQYRRYRRKTRAPYRKTSRTYRRSRRTGRYGRFRRRLPTAMLPWKYATRLKYETHGVITFPASGTMGVWVIRANSLFDPDYTFIGHQPRGFDQFSTLYNHYVVIGATIRVTFIPRGLTSTDTKEENMYVGIACKDDPSAVGISTANDYIEGRKVVYRTIINNSVQQRSPTLTMSVNPNKFLGISKPLSSYLVRCTTLANPVDGVFFHIFAEPLDSSAQPDPIRCQITVRYTCVFTEPKQPGQS